MRGAAEAPPARPACRPEHPGTGRAFVRSGEIEDRTMNPLDAFDTVTHARLRARQGDVRGARRVLYRILDVRPEDGAARDLLTSLEGVKQQGASSEPRAALAPPVAAHPEDLAARFRGALARGAVGPASRLRSLLRKVETAGAAGPDEGGES